MTPQVDTTNHQDALLGHDCPTQFCVECDVPHAIGEHLT